MVDCEHGVRRDEQEKADAKNDLETYIYDAKEKLWDDELEKVSTEEQREEARDALSAAAEWLENEGVDVGVQEYKYALPFPPPSPLSLSLQLLTLMRVVCASAGTRRPSSSSWPTPSSSARRSSPSVPCRWPCSPTCSTTADLRSSVSPR
jgi:hypothetical protein